MHIKGKIEANILNNDFLIKTNIGHAVILGTPFINVITPYKTTPGSIDFKSKYITLSFPFIEKPRTWYHNLIKANSIYQREISVLIK